MKNISFVVGGIVALACLLVQTASADVFADARHYFVFEEDLNGDGIVQANEVRDLRHWGRLDSYTHAVQASNF